MLRLLSIANFATIERLDLELGPGLTVLTGETGAGKSIIVDALSLLVGGRADGGVVRSGAAQARVEGVLELDEDLRKRLASEIPELGLDDGGDDLVLAREINVEGKNLCRIGGRIAPARTLEALGQRLADIHGQSQHLSLYRVREHLDILDRFAGLAELRSSMGVLADRLRKVRKDLAGVVQGERERAQRLDLLQYQVQDIEAAGLSPEEDEQLAAKRDLANNAEQLLSLASEAYDALRDREGSALDLLGAVVRGIGRLEKLDPSLAAARETAEGLLYQAEDLAQSLRSYRDNIDHNPERLQQIEERLDQIDRLKRKYGDSLAEVIAFAEQASLELEQLTHGEEQRRRLEKEEQALLVQAGETAHALSQARQEAAQRMAAAIERQLADLAMQRTRFGVDIQQHPADDGLPAGADGAPPGLRRQGCGQGGVPRFPESRRAASAACPDRLGRRGRPVDVGDQIHSVRRGPSPYPGLRRGGRGHRRPHWERCGAEAQEYRRAAPGPMRHAPAPDRLLRRPARQGGEGYQG